jgi:hypothetical protein
VKRRALLSAVAAGSVAGCASQSQVPPRVVGVNGRHVDTVVCGEVIRSPCNSFDRVDPWEEPSSNTFSDKEKVWIEKYKDSINIRGKIEGIGDPRCRETRISKIRKSKKSLMINVRNRESLNPAGCEENVRNVQYLVSLSPRLSRKIYKITVNHYSNYSEKNKKVFSESKNISNL